jgi:hypothetical protein
MDPTRIGLFELAERPLAWADQRRAVQLVKVADTDTTHALVTAIYRAYLGMCNTAIGRTSSG